MHLAWNMAIMTKGGFSCSVIVPTHQPSINPWGEVQKEKISCIEFHGHQQEKAEMERQLAMVVIEMDSSNLPAVWVQTEKMCRLISRPVQTLICRFLVGETRTHTF